MTNALDRIRVEAEIAWADQRLTRALTGAERRDARRRLRSQLLTTTDRRATADALVERELAARPRRARWTTGIVAAGVAAAAVWVAARERTELRFDDDKAHHTPVPWLPIALAALTALIVAGRIWRDYRSVDALVGPVPDPVAPRRHHVARAAGLTLRLALPAALLAALVAVGVDRVTWSSRLASTELRSHRVASHVPDRDGIVDVDGDGKLDLIADAFTTGSQAPTVALQSRPRHFRRTSEAAPDPPADGPSHTFDRTVGFGDMTGDGVVDQVGLRTESSPSTGSGSNERRTWMTIREGRADGSFAAARRLEVRDADGKPIPDLDDFPTSDGTQVRTQMATGLVADDRLTGVLLTQFARRPPQARGEPPAPPEETVTLLVPDGHGGLVVRKRLTGSTAFFTDHLDVDGDGTMDALGLGRDGRMHALDGATGAVTDVGPRSPFTTTAIAEVDGNGRADLIDIDGAGRLHAEPGTPAGTFGAPTLLTRQLYAPGMIGAIDAGDVTGDGIPDLLVTVYPKGDAFDENPSERHPPIRHLQILDGGHDGQFTKRRPPFALGDLNLEAVRDVDGDGRADLVLSEWIGRSTGDRVFTRIAWGRGDGAFE